MCNCPSCGWKIYTKYALQIPCPQCKTLTVCNGLSIPQEKPTPADKWPTWAVLVKCCRYKEDIGIGDTVKRMADSIGGERFKRWAEQCGIPCGCTERQERWNQMYPY